jgi:multidrug efflux pump subunit AcrB
MNRAEPGISLAGTWLGRPVTALCVLLAMGALSLAVLAGRENIPSRETGGLGFTIILRHYGVDAREMERTIAVPLEDALSAVNGVKQILSSSENGQVRVFIRFDRPAPGLYETVSEAVQRVYETLPPSAQRPEILSSDDTRIPLWTAAVFRAEPAGEPSGGISGGISEGISPEIPPRGKEEIPALGRVLERVVKPALEGIEGVGEVEISGAGLPEIVVALKDEEAAARGLSARSIAAFLGREDLLLPAGRLRYGERDLLVMVDGRYPDAASLAGAYLPVESGKPVRLGEVARIYERDREPDTLARLNGKKAAVISVMAGSGAETGALSRRIQGELKKLSDLPLELMVLSDRGAEERAAFRSVLEAALQGAFAVALTAALLGSGQAGPGKSLSGRGQRRRVLGPALICALTIPFICLLSAALLAVLGFSLNRVLLAGLSAGVGAAVDAAVLSSEGLRKLRSPAEGRKALEKLRAPLISGSVTTVAALIPLAAMDTLTADISAVAWAVGSVTLVSLIVALTLLPPLLLWGMGGPDMPGLSFPLGKAGRRVPWTLAPPRLLGVRRYFRRYLRFMSRRFLRLGVRLLAANVRFCLNRSGLSLLPALLFTIGGIGALIFAGTDIGAAPSEDSIYAQVEFEGGFLAEEADRLLGVFSEELTRKEGIKSVQTSARTGSGSVLVSFDPEKIKTGQVRSLLREKRIPGAFVYIPEMSAGERIWEITVSGDDDALCRKLAEEAARLAAPAPPVQERVLNFKTSSPGLTLIPDRERLEEAELLFSDVADTVRRGVHGPVAYKRIGPRGETDVRVRGKGGELLSREETGSLLIPGKGEGSLIPVLRLDAVTDKREGFEPSSIRRENRRRIASISIRTKPMDPRDVRNRVMGLLEQMELPRGYTISFDPEAIRTAEALSGTVGFFLLALLFCAMVIAAANESFGIPLAVLSVVPPSLAVPALFMVFRGYPMNAAVACAFVAVSGMAVNASVLITDEIRRFLGRPGKNPGRGLYRALRNRIPALLATTLTTVAGAIPFLFLREDSNMIVRVLSLVTLLGVGASAVFSLTMIPGLAKIFPKIFVSFEASPISTP